jgi:hypothetical protein
MFSKNIVSNVILIGIIYCIFLFCNEKNKEYFYVWNLPTRWNRPIYDIRGYPNTFKNYVFLHRGKVYSNDYIDMYRYPELYNYMPYYYNGMIYTANGNYKYDTYSKYFDFPIIYYTRSNYIDWMGLINNGIISAT